VTTPLHEWSRRRLMMTGIVAGSALTAGARAATASTESAGAMENAMMFDLTVRIAAGRLADWERFWGDENVPALEANGQWLWGAWTSISGRQNAITHEWAYRDLGHYESMVKMRSSNAQVHALAARGIPIEENLLSSVMTPLPYHPSQPYRPPTGQTGIIVTHRIAVERPGNTPDHSAIAADYVARATRHGAVLVGAYQSFFGWTPASLLQIWRYESMEQYARARQATESEPRCQQLLSGMRAIYPHETVELHRPLRYSRIR
jgi:hypothetical protein